MSYLLSFSLLEANTNDKATYHAMRAGGSLVGESILSRYDRHLTERRYAHTPLVAPVGFEPRLLVMSQVSCHCSTSAILLSVQQPSVCSALPQSKFPIGQEVRLNDRWLRGLDSNQ